MVYTESVTKDNTSQTQRQQVFCCDNYPVVKFLFLPSIPETCSGKVVNHYLLDFALTEL